MIVSFTSTSCLFSSNKDNNTTNEGQFHDNEVAEIRNDNSLNLDDFAQQGLKQFAIMDKPSGLICCTIPFPSNWRRSKQNEFLFEGPNKIKISGAANSNFMFTNQQDIAWNFQQQGIQNTPPMSINQIINQFFMAYAQKTGKTLTSTYPLPEYVKSLRLFYNSLFVSVPTQRDIKAYALEWKDNNGMSFITALVINIAYSTPSSSWSLTQQYLEAPNADFKKAKEAFLYGLIHTTYNPQWILARNQKDAKASNRQYQGHLSRMAIINARRNASKSVGDTYSEILDINHEGYLRRSDINSNAHSKTMNMVNERTVISNHSTGEHYNVQSGSNYYWVDNSGQYFGTNNALLDPRTDKRFNEKRWTQFQIENNK
jgi:hypothetical protein